MHRAYTKYQSKMRTSCVNDFVESLVMVIVVGDAINQWRKNWKGVLLLTTLTFNSCCNVAGLKFKLFKLPYNIKNMSFQPLFLWGTVISVR